jgi:hypothetical protein
MQSNLAATLQARYRSDGSTDDLEQAVSLLRQAIDATRSGHPDRVVVQANLALLESQLERAGRGR